MARAAGGVGLFAVQLAHLSGAKVAAVIKTIEHGALLEEYGADHVVLGAVSGAAPFGPYQVALIDSADDLDLTIALRLMAMHGLCVVYGTARAAPAHVANPGFIEHSVRLHGLALFDEPRPEPRSEDLRRLLNLVAEHGLQPHIEIEESWTEIAAVAQKLEAQDFAGRAVLHL